MVQKVKKNFGEKGQSLFEVLVALFIISMVTVGIVNVSASSVRNNIASRNTSMATSYAEEVISWLRVIRDKDGFEEFSIALGEDSDAKVCVTEIYESLGELFSPPNTGNCAVDQTIENTPFKRELVLTLDTGGPGKNDDKVGIYVIVEWEDSQGKHESRLETELTRWTELNKNLLPVNIL